MSLVSVHGSVIALHCGMCPKRRTWKYVTHSLTRSWESGDARTSLMRRYNQVHPIVHCFAELLKRATRFQEGKLLESYFVIVVTN